MESLYRLTEEQEAMRQMVRRLARERVAPRVAEIDEKEEYPEDLYLLLRDNELMAVSFPAEYGGLGKSLLTSCVVAEELAKVSGDAAMIPVTHDLGSMPLILAGSHEQKQKYLTRMATGEHTAAFGLTEPGGGSDVAAISTRADVEGDYYVIRGSKCFISYADTAKIMSVFAKTDPDADGLKGISAFIFETNTPGLTLGKKEKKMGFRGCPNFQLFFKNCRIPKENLLGAPGDGFRIAMVTLDYTRPLVAAIAVGIAQGALDDAIQYSKEVFQFGSPIAEFQGPQFMMADMAINIEAARQLVYRAACEIDQGGEDMAKFGAMAKCFATDTCMRVTTDAVQVLGEYGYLQDYNLERRMRDAKLLQIVEGTNQIQRMVVSKRLLT